MKIDRILLLTLCCILFFNACSNDEPSPIEKDNVPPSPVSNVTSTSLPGSVLLSYTLPGDPDLLYISGKYTNKVGKEMEFRSSYYINSLLLEGFGDTDEYEVELYAVDRSENRSQPVKVKVRPDLPPLVSTYKSLEVREDFGGMNFTFENEVEADFVINVCTTDSLGDMTIIETFYTSRSIGSFSVRGFVDEPRVFGIFIKDKWENVTDTLFQELTPIYERELDKSLFREVLLPGDSPTSAYDNKMEYIWDGRISSDGDGQAGAHTGTDPKTEPTYFTFDLGVLARLSRFKLHCVQDEKHYYNDVTPRLYEIWGCGEDINMNGSWDNWVKLVDFENVKPSNYPVGVLSNEDIEAAKMGDEADIPLDMPKVRYIRVRCLKNWSNNFNMTFTEITFWGNDRE